MVAIEKSAAAAEVSKKAPFKALCSPERVLFYAFFLSFAAKMLHNSIKICINETAFLLSTCCRIYNESAVTKPLPGREDGKSWKDFKSSDALTLTSPTHEKLKECDV